MNIEEFMATRQKTQPVSTKMSIDDFMAGKQKIKPVVQPDQSQGEPIATVQTVSSEPKRKTFSEILKENTGTFGTPAVREKPVIDDSKKAQYALMASKDLEKKGVPQKALEGIGAGLAMGHDILFGGAKTVGEGIATGLVETGVYIPGTNIGFGGQRQKLEAQGADIDRSGDPTGLQVIGGAGEVGLDVLTGGVGAKLITQAGKAVSKSVGQKSGREFIKQLGRRLSTMPQLAQNIAIGAGFGTAGSLQTGNDQLDEIILDAAIGAGLGGSLSAIGKFAGKTAEKADAIGSANKTVFKAIKPRLTKKRNLNKVEGEYALANKTLVDMGIIPTDVKSYRDGIAKAKDDIWSEISQKVEDGQGVVDFGKIADEVRSMANETALKRVDPNASKKLNSIADGLVAEGVNVSPAEAERVKQYLNAELSGAFGEFNLSKAEQNAKKRITASIGKQLDDILSVDRPGEFQELKNKYGALAAITDDVEKRFIVFERANPAGLVESFGAVEGGANILKGIMTASPSDIIKGAAQFGLGRMQKKANDANELIKKSFKKLNQSYPPQSGKLSTPKAKPQTTQSSSKIILEEEEYANEILDYLQSVTGKNKISLRKEFSESGDSIETFLAKKEAELDNIVNRVDVDIDVTELTETVKRYTDMGALQFAKKYSGGEFKGKSLAEARDFIEKKDVAFFEKHGLDIGSQEGVTSSDEAFDLVKKEFLEKGGRKVLTKNNSIKK